MHELERTAARPTGTLSTLLAPCPPGDLGGAPFLEQPPMSSSLILALSALLAAAGACAALAWKLRGARRGARLQVAYLDELMESSAEAAALVDQGGRIRRCNEAFAELFRRPCDELRHRTFAELLAPGEEGEIDGLEKRIAAGRPVRAALTAVGPDGETTEISVLGAPARVADQPVRYLILCRDITQRTLAETALRRLEKAVETMQIGVTVTDLEGRIVYTNPADAELHGYSREELLGKDVRVFAPDDISDAHPLTPGELDELERWSRESVNVRRDGSTFPCQLMSDVVRDVEGRPIGIVTTCGDITERKEAERALRESEERFALAIQGATDGLWDWHLERGEIYVSPQWKALLGYGEDEIGNDPEEWLGRVHPDDRPGLRQDLDAHRRGLTSRLENEHRLLHGDGSYRWVLVRGKAKREESGETVRIAGSMSDITERKVAEKQLTQEALYDPLTGLPNRAFLTDLLDRAHRRAQRQEEARFAVLFLDLDRFKEVNDALGHAAGDEMLREVSGRLIRSVRPGDVVSRFAGDEFCILLDDLSDARDTTRVAERVQEALRDPVWIDGREVYTSASIGIAVSRGGGPEPATLLRNADNAMYRAKARGRDHYEVFDRRMHERVAERHSLEEDLRIALEEEQFRVCYQPVVNLDTGTITALEALVRWRHPERGPVPVNTFLSVAEETGLIVPLGWWVLNEACGQMAAWSRRFPRFQDVAVGVNLSSRQLRQPDLVERIREALRAAELPPRRLTLEVKEGDLMGDPEVHAPVIRRIRELGVDVEIDDFGTMSSFIQYLDQFQVSALKLDPSFIRLSDGGRDRDPVLQAIITLARSLGIRVVAEGVETSRQSDRLRDLRCEQGQGYLFAHPLESGAVDQLLATRPAGFSGVRPREA